MKEEFALNHQRIQYVERPTDFPKGICKRKKTAHKHKQKTNKQSEHFNLMKSSLKIRGIKLVIINMGCMTNGRNGASMTFMVEGKMK